MGTCARDGVRQSQFPGTTVLKHVKHARHAQAEERCPLELQRFDAIGVAAPPVVQQSKEQIPAVDFLAREIGRCA